MSASEITLSERSWSETLSQLRVMAWENTVAIECSREGHDR